MISYVPVFYFIVFLMQFYPIVITQLINNEVLVNNLGANKSGYLSQLVSAETQVLLVIAYIIRYVSAISYFGFRKEEIFTQILKFVQIMSWVFLFLRLISKKRELQTQFKIDTKPTYFETIAQNISGRKIMWIIFISFFLGIFGNYFKMLDANNLLDYKVVLMDVGAIIARLAIIPQCLLVYQQVKTNTKFTGRQIFVILRWILFFGVSKGFYIADQAGEIANGRILFLALIFEVIFLVSTLVVVAYMQCTKKEESSSSEIDYSFSQGSQIQNKSMQKLEDQHVRLYAKM